MQNDPDCAPTTRRRPSCRGSRRRSARPATTSSKTPRVAAGDRARAGDQRCPGTDRPSDHWWCGRAARSGRSTTARSCSTIARPRRSTSTIATPGLTRGGRRIQDSDALADRSPGDGLFPKFMTRNRSVGSGPAVGRGTQESAEGSRPDGQGPRRPAQVEA